MGYGSDRLHCKVRIGWRPVGTVQTRGLTFLCGVGNDSCFDRLRKDTDTCALLLNMVLMLRGVRSLIREVMVAVMHCDLCICTHTILKQVSSRLCLWAAACVTVWVVFNLSRGGIS